MGLIEYKEINSLEEFNLRKGEANISLFYFSHEACNVCKVLKPKISSLILSQFPEIRLYYIDTVSNPELAAQNSIFTVPVMLITFEEKEYIRKARNIGMNELENELGKLYRMIH